MARTQKDKRRPLLQGGNTPRELYEELAQERDPLYEEIADITIKTDEQSAKGVAGYIIDKIEQI